jgi:hypothetical protein
MGGEQVQLIREMVKCLRMEAVVRLWPAVLREVRHHGTHGRPVGGYLYGSL